jgi:Tol biopolymer transport system component
MYHTVQIYSMLAVLLAIGSARAQNPTDYGTPRIFVADKDGNNVKLLVEIPGMASHGSPHWSSDGKLILINSTPQARAYHLSKMFVCAVGGPFSGNVAELGPGGCARFSPDMNRIAFHINAGNPEGIEAGIWVMKDDGTEKKRLCEGTRPRWLPDGKSLLFVSPQPGGATIEMIQIDGTGRRQLLKAGYPQVAGGDPSPDGKEFCYLAYPQRAYEGQLFRAAIAGEGEPKLIYSGRMGWDPAWSPDGKQILFWAMDDKANRHLCVIDAEGGQPTKLANQEGTRFNSDAQWSPDGQKIVFSSDRDFAEK